MVPALLVIHPKPLRTKLKFAPAFLMVIRGRAGVEAELILHANISSFSQLYLLEQVIALVIRISQSIILQHLF